MPTFENLESLASVRAKINDGIQNAETALSRLDTLDPTIANHETRIQDLEDLGFSGVTDGDKGDVIVTDGGLTWTLDPTTAANLRDRTTHTGVQNISTVSGTRAQFDAAVTDANFSFVGDAPTAHTHSLSEVTDVTITASNLNALDDGVDTTLHFHSSDRARANHTGTQAAETITGLAAVATSGSASDLSAGTLPAARFDDTTHGNRSGGSLHADVIASGASGFMTGADKAKLDAISGTNTGDQTSIVGITGTKAQFDSAVTDGNLMYVGDAPTAHTHTLSEVTDVTISAANLNSLDDGVNSTLHFHDSDRSRANHTGTQTASTISDFNEAVDDRVSSLIVAGTNVTATYDDLANTLTISSATVVPDGDKGDITVSATGTTWTLDANVVDNTKAADMASQTIKGRTTAGSGDPEDLTAAQVRTLLNVADGANNYVHPNHSGDVVSTGDGATTIQDNTVSFAKMQDLTASRLLGRGSSGAGDPQELSLGGGLEFTGSTILRVGAFTGDVTKTAGGTSLTLADGAVTFAKLAGAAVITSGETIASNDSNTAVPTSAAVIDYVPVALNASGSAPIYACRAWVNFNGTGTVAIRASGNVSSITDNGPGDYTINFATSLPDANYAAAAMGSVIGSDGRFIIESGSTRTASGMRVVTVNAAGSATDATYVNIAAFR